MKDPDMNRDGIFSGYYNPPGNGVFNISIQIERTTAPKPIASFVSASVSNDPASYAMSIDQSIIYSFF